MVSGINGFGSFQAASLSEMRQTMFNMIDQNGDGSIDKSELTALSQQNGSDLVDEIFSKVDTNQDDLISKIEFDASLAKMEQQMKNGDSGMSALSGMPPPPPPENVFDTADTNDDGFVSKDELTAVMGQNGNNIDKIFSQVDTDGDGLISKTEDESFHEKMKDRMRGSPPPGLAMNDIGGYGQDWQSKLLDALLNGLNDTDSASNTSPSLYA